MSIAISAPGKVILSGEHAVVYGKPALVAAVDRRMEIALEIVHDTVSISGTSAIPIGCGMGSSAALSVIQAAAVDQLCDLGLSPAQINSIAYDLEKKHHGTPSGVDNTVATVGGFIWYRKEFEFLKNIWQLPMKISQNLDHFVMINSGKPAESTGEMVETVKTQMLRVKSSKRTQRIFNDIERQTKKMLIALRGESARDLQSSIQENNRLLIELGVVGKKAQKVISQIEDAGGVAKVTGAGGIQKGSGMLVCWHSDPDKLMKHAKKLDLESFPIKLGGEGLVVA